MSQRFATQRIFTASGCVRNTFGDFVCMHCHGFVSTPVALAGAHAQHRNHCPRCLSSRHLDLFQAGDRLSAYKALMKPIGLTLKRACRKYAAEPQGELMLIHLCERCRELSINRIAADDDEEAILAVFKASLQIDPHTRSLLIEAGIMPLSAEAERLVSRRLFGDSRAVFN